MLDKGFRVYGSVRKQGDAERLRGEFGANFTPLMFDITDEAAVLAGAREVRTALNGETLAGLVNSAGIAVAGPVLELSADEFRRQLNVNGMPQGLSKADGQPALTVCLLLADAIAISRSASTANSGIRNKL